MDFSFSDDLVRWRDRVRHFVRTEVEPLATTLDRDDEFPASLHARLAELGLYGMAIPTEYGGLGLPLLYEAVAIEELSRTNLCVRSRITTNIGIGAMGILYGGSAAQRQRYLPPLARGERLSAFALTEPNAGSDAARIETRAVRRGEAFVLNGRKIFVTNGPHADYFTVFAVTDPAKGAHGGISAFLVERGTPGFTIGKRHELMGLRGSAACELVLADCTVPAANLLGELGQGFRLAMRTLDKGRIGMAAGGLGAAERLLERMAAETRARRGYDHHLLADCAIECEAARLLLYTTAARMDAGERCSTEASMAKLFATETAWRAADRAIQLFERGACLHEEIVERYYRDVRIMRIYDGSSEIQRLIIARALLSA